MEKDSPDKKIHVAVPIVLSILLGGAFFLSVGFFILFGGMVFAVSSQGFEYKVMGLMIILTPVSILAGLIGVWFSWNTGKKILMAPAFFLPGIWVGLLFLFSWIIGY